MVRGLQFHSSQISCKTNAEFLAGRNYGQFSNLENSLFLWWVSGCRGHEIMVKSLPGSTVTVAVQAMMNQMIGVNFGATMSRSWIPVACGRERSGLISISTK